MRNYGRAVIVSMLLTWRLLAAIVVIILITPTLLQKTRGADGSGTGGQSVATIGCVAVGAIIDQLGAGRFFALGSFLLGVSAWLFYAKGAAVPSFCRSKR